jgi:hypothetical protein
MLGGELRVDLQAVDAEWYPRGPDGPRVVTAAFAAPLVVPPGETRETRPAEGKRPAAEEPSEFPGTRAAADGIAGADPRLRGDAASRADTMQVAPPTGVTETDRASIVAALERAKPGDTVLPNVLRR